MTDASYGGQAVTLAPDEDFRQRLIELAGSSFTQCYQCGTCSAVCPFSSQETAELPRRQILMAQWGLKDELFGDPAVWMCTTCGNCARLCPREVKIPETIRAIREILVAERAPTPELATAFAHTATRGNPLGEPARKRTEWTAGEHVPILADLGRPVDMLFYVECYWAYHPRGRQAAQAMARTLNRLSVDWAILGREEQCVGDSQRLAGETGLFEALAEKNIATLQRYEFGRLVTPDPHAYNAFLHQYPTLGGAWPVQHYTQFLAERLGDMDLKPIPDRVVSFHDPCYLGRHNGEYDAPRRLLNAIPGVHLNEMAHCRENGFCCGGGGGGVWNSGFVAEYVDERLAVHRVREAVAAGAEVLAVCCPFEVSLFEDAAKQAGFADRLQVRDIIELLDESLRG